ncbi:MAG TPA: glycerophosphodiester phosphodiesterase [Solirubrobacterales bacterium]|nr:glycerophosphodiester phosphodiesterase [Solirubrobacterales bacterium]
MQIPALYAHRLGRAYGPDSSATALAASLAAGVDGLETDVCVTADDELVLLHDPLLTLGTTLGGWAHRRSATEILRARTLDRNGEPTAERAMTLDELLAATPSDLPIQVEVKAHADPELARRTAQILCERYRTGPERRRLELISFHSAACATAAAYGLRSRLVVWAEYAPEALAAWAVSRGVTGVSVEHFLLAPKLVAVLRLAGLSVSTGTVNDAELLARVTELALPDAVCTDRPAELRAEALRLEEAPSTSVLLDAEPAPATPSAPAGC